MRKGEEGAGADRGVLLAALPLSSARYPSLALGLLKAAVVRTGVPCEVRYFSLEYIDTVGADVFACLDDPRTYMGLVGEWLFTEAALGGDAPCAPMDILEYLTSAYAPRSPPRELASRLIAILEARRDAASFIDRCVESVDWSRVAVLGVSSSFQQNMASLAFARRVRARYPDVLIVFGGANCQGEMGAALHHCFPWIDAVCLGEADRTFPELVRRHLDGRDLTGIPGFVVRGPDRESCLPAREIDQIDDLDTLPYPDFTDFYRQRADTAAIAETRHALMFETARGCWWGAKHHCTFCGINGRMMSYRSKSQHRVYEELCHLVALHGTDVVTADAILDPGYFTEFLPRLASAGPAVSIFWQMKSNIRPEQLTLLARAGVRRIQPGIEALDTPLLALMDKGCTALQNVQILKLAAENGLSVAWNLLYGFPGEEPESYARTAALIPSLYHLQPPSSTGRVYADRFSPYFQRPEVFGVQLEPVDAYRLIYPFEDATVRALAYHFRMHSAALDGIEDAVAPMRAAQRNWKSHWLKSSLSYEDDGDTLTVQETRWGWPHGVTNLEGPDADLLRLCWKITPWITVQEQLGGSREQAALRQAADRLLERGWLIEEGRQLLALPLRQPGLRRAPSWAEVMGAETIPYTLRDTLRET